MRGKTLALRMNLLPMFVQMVKSFLISFMNKSNVIVRLDLQLLEHSVHFFIERGIIKIEVKETYL